MTWQITNTGSAPLPLDRLDLSWPAANGPIKKIRWDGDKIFDQRAPGPALQIRFGAGNGPAAPRLDPGRTVTLTLEFESTALTS